MSRVSLSRRMAAVEAAIRKRDPFGYAIHNLTPQMRKIYDDWRTDCARITAQHENPFSAWLNGQCHFPRMPHAVATAIDSRLCSHPLRSGCTDNEAQDAYKALLGEDAR